MSFLQIAILLVPLLLLLPEKECLAADDSADEMKSLRSSLLRSARSKSAKDDAGVGSGKLDNATYTAVGAERAGNADGSIPAWTGKMDGLPKGLVYKSTTDVRPDPYANEKPLFIITSKNMGQYADKLSDGQKALFKKYPDTFAMPVYVTHRDAKISDFLTQRAAFNAENTKMVNGIDGLQGYTGGVPFPFPRDGAEVMWNGRLALFHHTLFGFFDQYAVYPNGQRDWMRQKYVAEFPFSNPDNIVGIVDDKIATNAGLVHVTVEKPDRERGQFVVVHEALDQVRNERMAWAYIPATQRVRRAPTVGFDTPDGPGGLLTVDDSLGFNGAMYKYRWKFVGKKEMYIPYHNYKMDTPNVPVEKLLPVGHANPEFMRYELHRVWVVEANLVEGQRHIYAKRRFFMDEDSWQFVSTESYDGRGDLWRVSILCSVYDFLLKTYIPRVQMYHDLQRGSFIAQRMVNYVKPPELNGESMGEAFYSPSSMRREGGVN